ncbi:MAG: hypothetical protein Hals2KO_13020 [Halioglobus sp.]
MKPLMSKPPTPYCCTIGKRITTNAAVGPVMFTLDPPVIALMPPAMIAVYRPCCGGRPLAMASAIDNGSAIMPTIRPAITFPRIDGILKSCLIVSRRADNKGLFS